MPKQKGVWQPKKRKRAKKHGFLKRMSSSNGINILKRRMKKGRKRLAVKPSSK